MDNYIIVKKENGESIKIEIILSFIVKELNKKYIAYTINDDGQKKLVAVMISEIDDNGLLKEIPEKEKNLVINAYKNAKDLVYLNCDNVQVNKLPWE